MSKDKHIFQVKQSERVEAQNARAKAEKKQKLMGLIESKQEAALEGLSVEELTAMLNEL